jgi:hypothetical protein
MGLSISALHCAFELKESATKFADKEQITIDYDTTT